MFQITMTRILTLFAILALQTRGTVLAAPSWKSFHIVKGKDDVHEVKCFIS